MEAFNYSEEEEGSLLGVFTNVNKMKYRIANVWGAANAVLRGKFIVPKTHEKREEVSSQQSKHLPEEPGKRRAKQTQTK